MTDELPEPTEDIRTDEAPSFMIEPVLDLSFQMEPL